MADRIPRDERDALAIEAGRVFRPASPVSEEELFAGRTDQLRRVIDAINQEGQHVLIFGERGVGKTSLANILSSRLQNPSGTLLTPHVNCETGDDYSTVWKKVFGEIEISKRVRRIGFGSQAEDHADDLLEDLPRKLNSGDVRNTLRLIAPTSLLVIVIDEFDRVRSPSVRAQFADTVKMLSDYSLNATLILVGVADTVEDLIKEHASIERALVQVPMPRMSAAELNQIVQKGLDRLGMRVQGSVLTRIAALSRGLPHFAHLLGRHAARRAIDEGMRIITDAHIESAIEESLEQAQHSIRSAYHKAVSSQRKDSLYQKVLLACALAEPDAMGFFTAADVRAPFQVITQRDYGIPNYAKHLNAFCTDDRGNILEKRGAVHRPRYRFTNPLMQPFAAMQGFVDRLIALDDLMPGGA